MMPGKPWEKYGRQAPINSGVNPATVTARQNADRGDAEFRYRINRDQEDDRVVKDKEERERDAAAQALASSAESVKRTIGILRGIRTDASDNGGWGETGTTGNMMRSVPWFSNAGKDLERKVQTVKGMNAFTALKDLAAQGVKLTPISNAEIELAASSVANIDPSLSQEEFIQAVDQAIKFHQSTLKRLVAPSGTSAGKPARAAPPSDIQAIMRKYGAQ